MLLLHADQIEKLQRRKRARRVRPLKSPADAERDLQRRMKRLWKQVLKPATERIVQAVRDGASPAQLADMVEEVLRLAEFQYGLEADDIIWRWQMKTDRGVRGWIQRGLQGSLGVDISAVLDTPQVAEALTMARAEAASLIRTIPAQYLGQVARAVGDNFRGIPLPEGRSLEKHIQHLGGVSEKRARVIARDQTTKLTGQLNKVRQESIGITEYTWRTVKDNRVVGNPAGVSPKGNDKHMDHYHRDGKVFKWAEPPPDGHPGQAIQCRCHAAPVIDVKKLLAHVREG